MQRMIGFVKARMAAAKAFGVAGRVKAARLLGATEALGRLGKYASAKSWGISSTRLGKLDTMLAQKHEKTALMGGQITEKDIGKWEKALGMKAPGNSATAKVADLNAIRARRIAETELQARLHPGTRQEPPTQKAA